MSLLQLYVLIGGKVVFAALHYVCLFRAVLVGSCCNFADTHAVLYSNTFTVRSQTHIPTHTLSYVQTFWRNSPPPPAVHKKRVKPW